MQVEVKIFTKNLNFVVVCYIVKRNSNSSGQQFYQYQQNEQSSHLKQLNTKKTTKYAVKPSLVMTSIKLQSNLL